MIDEERTSEQDTVAANYAEHVKLWESSGINQVSYCQANGLDYKRFVGFRSKLLSLRGTSKKQKPRFISVQATQPVATSPLIGTPKQAAHILLHLPKGSVIEIPATLRPRQLTSLFKSLGGIL